MLRQLRNLSFLILLGVAFLPTRSGAVSVGSCDEEDFYCQRKQLDFYGCANNCAGLLVECIAQCGGDAPAEWSCEPPGEYVAPNKKDGWCYCYTGPCSG